MSKQRTEENPILTEQELYDLHGEYIDARGTVAEACIDARRQGDSKRYQALTDYGRFLRVQYFDFLLTQPHANEEWKRFMSLPRQTKTYTTT